MGKFTFCLEIKKKVKNVSKPANIRFHPPSTAYFPFKGDNRQPYFPFKGLFSLTGISIRWGYGKVANVEELLNKALKGFGCVPNPSVR